MKISDINDTTVDFLVGTSNESTQEVLAVLEEYFTLTGKDFIPSIKILVCESVRNAVEWGNQFLESKNVRIRITLEGENVTVMIEDEGNGFNQTILDFFAELDPMELQKEREKMGKRPGGLGVKICKGLAKNLVYNEKGNCVSFTLPMHPVTSDPSPIEQVKQAGSETSRQRILIVEDDETVSRLYQSMLEQAGYDYFAVSNGFAASVVFAAYNPHVIIMDLEMPVLDGMKTLEYLRESRIQTNTIVVSGVVDDDRARTLKDLGIPFLRKPVNVEEFLSHIRDLAHAAHVNQ